MNRTVRRGVVLAGVSAGVIAARRITTRQAGNGADPDRWHTVTVNRPPEEVAPEGRLPDPLAGLGDAVEVRLRPAPGGRGTELAVRLRDGAPAGAAEAVARAAGSDPRAGSARWRPGRPCCWGPSGSSPSTATATGWR